eukprot:2520437-Amphidinium_carterae.1
MSPVWAVVATRQKDGLHSAIPVIYKVTNVKQFSREFKLADTRLLASMKADTFGTTWPVLSQLSCTNFAKS